MADQGILNHSLAEMVRLLPNFTGSTQERRDYLEDVIKVVLEYLDPEIVAQIALPAHNINTLVHGSLDGDRLPNPLPDMLKQHNKNGRHKVFVIDLSVSSGTMSNIQNIVLDVNRFAKSFSIPGGYGQSIERHAITKVVERVDGQSGDHVHLNTHPETRLYFSRILSFVPAHKLNDKRRFDIGVKSDPEHYTLHADVRESIFLGSIPCLDNNQPIDLAVQQGSSVFGFHLRNGVSDQIACQTVVRKRHVETAVLSPRGNCTVAISPRIVNTVNLHHVFVPEPIKGWSHPRKRRCLSALGTG